MLIVILLLLMFVLYMRFSLLFRRLLEDQKHPYHRDLDPEVIQGFHQLSLEQRTSLFHSLVGIEHVIEGTNFELFWRSCFASASVERAKNLQDCLLNLDERQHEIIKLLILKFKRTATMEPLTQKKELKIVLQEPQAQKEPQFQRKHRHHIYQRNRSSKRKHRHCRHL